MIIDLYETLSLDRDDDVETLRARLQSLKAGYGARAARAGEEGDQARERLELIAQAQELFRDQTSRDDYDLALARAARQGEVDTPEVDWLTKARDYYFADDIGAAEIAVARARQQSPDDPRVYVLAAWVEINIAAHRNGNMTLDERYRQARQLADEAMVVDTEDEYTLDVYEVRGAALGVSGDTSRAVDSYDRAIEKAVGNQRGLLNYHKAGCLPPVESANVCLATLYAAEAPEDDRWSPALEPSTIDLLVRRWCDNVDRVQPSASNQPVGIHATVSWSEVDKFYTDLLAQFGEPRFEWERRIHAHLDARLDQVETGRRAADEVNGLEQKKADLDKEISQQHDHRRKLNDGFRRMMVSEPLGWFQFLGGFALVWAIVFGVLSMASFSWAEGRWWWGVIPVAALPFVIVFSYISLKAEERKADNAMDETRARINAINDRIRSQRAQQDQCVQALHQPL